MFQNFYNGGEALFRGNENLVFFVHYCPLILIYVDIDNFDHFYHFLKKTQLDMYSSSNDFFQVFRPNIPKFKTKFDNNATNPGPLALV